MTRLVMAAFCLCLFGCEAETAPPKPPVEEPEICLMPPGDAACVALDDIVYPVTEAECGALSKAAYFCRQEPAHESCVKAERDGMWCCCNQASDPSCTASSSLAKDQNSAVCDVPAGNAVCMLLDKSVYTGFAGACTAINTKAVPYFCVDVPFDASCTRLEEGNIYCCCDPRTDMYCEAHLAP